MNLESMFDRICSSNIVIASQQRNEPDFTREQKHAMLQHTYSVNPANFIYRFGYLLTDDELRQHFDPDADYMQRVATPIRHKLRANRRYTYMQQLLANGKYFSDEAMKERSPLLYEQMVGKYQDDANHPLVSRTANGPLADFYMEHLESLNHQERVENELQNEAQSADPEDAESDSDDDEDEGKLYSDAERHLYREEFLAIQKGNHTAH